ncbi:DUF366 family protein [Methanobrevibacter sp. OttesenSCG-928-K11]|nr:DUF366 family protein [Methanobrevibacter sp. OttesenSCG-928-K11]
MLIEHKHLNQSLKYDGSQINPSWAFKSFGIKNSSIITWFGPMDIKSDNLKDFEDVGLEIKSNNMIHFIVEFFDCQPANIKIAYLRQRLLVMIFREELFKLGIISTRKGDDIYINGSKLSVSIASVSISSMKIHFGLNIEDKGTPNDVKTIGLYDIIDNENKRIFNKNNILDLVNNVTLNYIEELTSIDEDISKTDCL